MRDLAYTIGPAFLLAPAALDADSTPVSVDLATYDGAAVLIHVGVGGITFTTSNKVEFKLRHGDSSTASEHEAVVQADVAGVTVGTGGIVRSLTAAHATASTTKIHYKGTKRYLSLLADFGGTHSTATPMCATVIRGYPLSGPVT